jgi:hypothetical protein
VSTFDDDLALLRSEFERHSRERLHTMRKTVDALALDPGNRRLLTELHTDFHAFAGLGATYGRPLATELGTAGEGRTAGILRDGGQVSDVDLASWRSALDELTTYFAQRSEP